MSEPERVEVQILGSGFGGNLLAWDLAKSGRRTAVVESRWIGGSCPNIACLPSKNEIWSARIAHQAHHAAEFGTVITGPVRTDMAKVRQRKREMVEGLIAMHLELYQKSGTDLIMGDGRFVAPKTLEVRLRDGGTRVLTGERVFINVGTRARRRRLRAVMVPVFASAWPSAGTCRLGSVKAVLTVSSRWLALGCLPRQPGRWC